jgi:hydroxymethylpyrimidine pyrophosphatase-like HAD family hydrolase/fructoselysine-6-P-deglycase FrlB-like protein
LGRPFDEELALLPSTYAWALQVNVEDLAKLVGWGSYLPLRSIGSGGSLSAAVFAAQLHQAFNAQVATAVTPLEITAHGAVARESASLFLSASGRNSDIIGALRFVAVRGAPSVSVICMQKQSPLSQVAEPFPHVGLCEFNSPAGRDGFLATNSLLGLCVLLLRAHERVRGLDLGLPSSLSGLLGRCALWGQIGDGTSDPFAPLWDRATTIILHGNSSRAAAVDLESKLTEAALASVQVSDYRNFAHGRHHWLAKRPATSGVLALVSHDDREVAERTLRLIPDNIPVVRLDAGRGGVVADLALLALGMYVTRSAGVARAIDPGRPQVPAFGRRLYHLNVFGRSGNRETRLPRAEAHAIERKAGQSIDLLEQTRELAAWRRSYKSFVRRLRATRFVGLALDYDGTLCDQRERFDGIGAAVVEELERLLRSGVAVGIATGRGRSVRADLQVKLSRAYWDRVTIGYYNGAEIGLLHDDDVPSVSQDLDESLVSLAEALERRSDIMTRATLTCRRYQITVEPIGVESISVLWERIQEVVQGARVEAISVLRSTHSVDILAPGVSKLNLVRILSTRSATPEHTDPAVLCIGDRGQWPGNDFALLSHPSALSVDEVSRDPETCWNLAPAGHQGAAAAVQYLRGLEVTSPGQFVARPPRPVMRPSRREETEE